VQHKLSLCLSWGCVGRGRREMQGQPCGSPTHSFPTSLPSPHFPVNKEPTKALQCRFILTMRGPLGWVPHPPPRWGGEITSHLCPARKCGIRGSICSAAPEGRHLSLNFVLMLHGVCFVKFLGSKKHFEQRKPTYINAREFNQNLSSIKIELKKFKLYTNNYIHQIYVVNQK
jgi:hypothetical protein